MRVAATEDAETADFAVVDDVADSSETSCATSPATQWVAVSASPSAASPVIYLSQEGPADYRIFVKSKRFTLREAAALIVGARGDRPLLVGRI